MVPLFLKEQKYTFLDLKYLLWSYFVDAKESMAGNLIRLNHPMIEIEYTFLDLKYLL